MKNSIISAVVGGSFFAIPYVFLAVPVLPSLAIGTSAFVAGELLFSKSKKDDFEIEKINIKKVLNVAKEQNRHIYNIKDKIDNDKIKNNLIEINKSVDKIISTIEKEPYKVKNLNNFFDYYLPITVKIVDRYDEIEDNNLSSKDSKKILKSTDEMVENINYAFKKMLDNLYKRDIIDMDTEIKVFNSMLASDGFDNNELGIKEDNNG